MGNKKLYHATYEPLLNDIARDGLGATDRTNWADAKPDAVYLSTDPNEAVSFAETAPDVPEGWLDRVVVLSVPADALTAGAIHDDEANRDPEARTVEYLGVIAPEHLSLHSAPGRKAESQQLRKR